LASIEQKCDSPRHIRTSNLPFWRIWGEWPLLIQNTKETEEAKSRYPSAFLFNPFPSTYFSTTKIFRMKRPKS
jgi:hypothetical protein